MVLLFDQQLYAIDSYKEAYVATVTKKTILMASAVIFDFDGVLFDTEAGKANIWKNMLAKFGVPNGDAWYRARMGKRLLTLCEEAIPQFNLPTTPEVMTEENMPSFRALEQEPAEPIIPMIDFARRLCHREGLALGIASSQPEAVMREQLRAIGAEDYFACFASIRDENLPGKPNPDVYLLAARQLGLEPVDCIGIEDTDAGVSAVKNAGMRCLGFKGAESLQNFLDADLVITPGDLDDLVIRAF